MPQEARFICLGEKQQSGAFFHWINQLHPVHNTLGFPDSHPMDSDLFSGQHYIQGFH